ncbi:MAG: M3 family metallopeptidase [Vicinamibacterales bacterium]
MSQPFLDTSFHIRWSTLTPDSVEPDITEALARAQRALDAIAGQDRARLTFESVVAAYDTATQDLHEAWILVAHLDAVCNSPERRKAYNAMLPRISAFSAGIPLNAELWDVVLTYSASDAARALDPVRTRAVDELVASFRQQGADLPAEKKARLEQLEAELSRATQKYSENVLDSTNAWELIVDDEALLAGLPQSAIDGARAEAQAKGLGSTDAPAYRFTLKAPSYLAVMEYASTESLRRQMWEGATSIGRGASFDNTDLIWQILRLRHEKAQLLGKANFADYALERRMARNGATALAFVEGLHAKTKAAFDREIASLERYAAEKTGRPRQPFQPWDLAWWMEQRRREQYDFDEEALRPYLSVKSVLAGMFTIAERLFDVTITERDAVFREPSADGTPADAPDGVEVWHPSVKFYEVHDADGAHRGSFFADWHPRDAKRGGGWMNCLKMGAPPDGDKARRPHLALICGNLTSPVGDAPALLTPYEVRVIFHEFGHLMHQMLADVPVISLNGLRVAWDFVELPSQLMENFCWERETLDLFARHHETGARVPDELFAKMIAARQYMGALMMMRQLSQGKLDLELHMHHATDEHADLDVLSRGLVRDYVVPLQTEAPTIARRFSHLFSRPGGYAASYYSYKWAEVLDADAFTRFQREGVLNPAVGRAFRDAVLSRGNSDSAEQLFREFMGRDPDPNALLVRAGLA